MDTPDSKDAAASNAAPLAFVTVTDIPDARALYPSNLFGFVARGTRGWKPRGTAPKSTWAGSSSKRKPAATSDSCRSVTPRPNTAIRWVPRRMATTDGRSGVVARTARSAPGYDVTGSSVVVLMPSVG
ncbi:MAG: hypothetical protein V9G12_08025 [Microthrixaceae bacterium]